jgi:predicted ATP-dependent endonuclease of OLD family
VIRLALELSATGPGTMLIEEPEVHLHAKSLALAARLVLQAARRGTQVIMTTHSLELIDMLLAQATADDLASLAVLRLRLESGVLRCIPVPGRDAAHARSEISEDLR